MKKCLCVLLVVLLILPAFSLGESADPVPGADFSFRVTLNPDAFSPVSRKRARAIADFLDAVRFSGSGYRNTERDVLDIRLSVIPEDPDAGTPEFHLFGHRDRPMLSSNLLGEGKDLLIACSSLLPFGLKTDAHLGFPLYKPMLLIPYVWEFATEKLSWKWIPVLSDARALGVLTQSDRAVLGDSLAESFLMDQDLIFLVNALTAASRDSETVSAEIESLPAWLCDPSVGDISVSAGESGETWTAADGRVLYRHRVSGNTETEETDLPATPGGYTPVWKLEKETSDTSVNLRLSAGWTRKDGESLLDLRMNITDFPLVPAVRADAKIDLDISGSMFPSLSLTCLLSSETDGSFRLEIKKNSGDCPTLLTAEGLLTPKSFEVAEYTEEDYAACFNVLTSADSTLPAYVKSVATPVAKGLLSFLKGIPVSFCQMVMDDLTETGVLDLLLSF